jgi:hypothetical protein
MENIMNHPVLVFALSLVVLWLSAQMGAYLHRRRRDQEEAEHEDLGVVLTASLTLLGLIIGFSFSMAVSRYDQRKNCEAEEANAIGTEYVRAGLLPTADAARVRDLLRSYADQRVLFYTTRDARLLEQVNTSTAHLQTDLWSTVQPVAASQPTPTVALAVSGMNDVLNSQGYTQAAWWNRIPGAAWALMAAIAICCNLLVGYNARSAEGKRRSFFLLPLVVSIAFFLVADLDSPRGGLILVHPHNLESVSHSLRMPQ